MGEISFRSLCATLVPEFSIPQADVHGRAADVVSEAGAGGEDELAGSGQCPRDGYPLFRRLLPDNRAKMGQRVITTEVVVVEKGVCGIFDWVVHGTLERSRT